MAASAKRKLITAADGLQMEFEKTRNNDRKKLGNNLNLNDLLEKVEKLVNQTANW